MEKSTENGQLEDSIFNLFTIIVELQPIMKAFNLGVQGGVILLCDEASDFEHWEKHLKKANIKITNITKPVILESSNDGLWICNHKTHYKPTNILEYLDSPTRAIPSIVIYKTMPIYLQNSANIIPLAKLNLSKNNRNTQLNIVKFIQYIRNNPSWLCSTMNAFHSSRICEQNNSESSLVLALKTCAYLLCSFYRQSNSETRTNILLQQLLNYIADFENAMETYTTDADVLFVIRKLLKNYVFENDDIIVANQDNIDGVTYDALTKDSAIIFDNFFYFIPEPLLKNACASLISTVSFLNIKRALHNENVLVINDNQSGGFTVKKVLVSSYGIITRTRFLKIRREFLSSVNEPNIEEKRRNP